MLDQENLEGHDNAAEVSLVIELLIVPLGILDVVHSDHGLILLEGARAGTSQLLHVSTASKDVADVNTHGTHVSAGLAGNPEDTHIALLVVVKHLGLVDGADTELLLDGGDQGRSLEDGASQGHQGLLDLLDLVNVLVELEDGDVLLTSGLLSLNQAGSIVNAGNQATGDLGI